MAGFVLGTGSGILAAAAVYYTLSVDLDVYLYAYSCDLLMCGCERVQPVPVGAAGSVRLIHRFEQ